MVAPLHACFVAMTVQPAPWLVALDRDHICQGPTRGLGVVEVEVEVEVCGGEGGIMIRSGNR